MKLQRLLEEYTKYKRSYLNNFKFDPELPGLSKYISILAFRVTLIENKFMFRFDH